MLSHSGGQIQNQDVVRAALPGEDLPAVPGMGALGSRLHPFKLCPTVPRPPPVCVHTSTRPSSYKETSPVGFRPNNLFFLD